MTGRALASIGVPAPAGTSVTVPALTSLAGQATGWGLVAAVAVLVVSAAGWAIASAAQNPAVASRAKTGVSVALAAAVLLGAGRGYIAWLDSRQAPAFAGDPASYAAATTDPSPGFEIIDRTEDWVAILNTLRTSQGLAAFGTDTTLKGVARDCAESLTGGPGRCPSRNLYQATTLAPKDLGLLQLDHPPNADGAGLLADYTGVSDDVRVAWVAVRNTTTFKTALVLVFANGPCADRCTVDDHGNAPGLIPGKTR